MQKSTYNTVMGYSASPLFYAIPAYLLAKHCFNISFPPAKNYFTENQCSYMCFLQSSLLGKQSVLLWWWWENLSFPKRSRPAVLTNFRMKLWHNKIVKGEMVIQKQVVTRSMIGIYLLSRWTCCISMRRLIQHHQHTIIKNKAVVSSSTLVS